MSTLGNILTYIARYIPLFKVPRCCMPWYADAALKSTSYIEVSWKCMGYHDMRVGIVEHDEILDKLGGIAFTNRDILHSTAVQLLVSERYYDVMCNVLGDEEIEGVLKTIYILYLATEAVADFGKEREHIAEQLVSLQTSGEVDDILACFDIFAAAHISAYRDYLWNNSGLLMKRRAHVSIGKVSNAFSVLHGQISLRLNKAAIF